MFVSCHLPVVRDGCQAAGQLKDSLRVFSHGADDEKHTRGAEGEISHHSSGLTENHIDIKIASCEVNYLFKKSIYKRSSYRIMISQKQTIA